MGLGRPPASLFLLFLLEDQEFHHVLGHLSYPLAQEVLGVLEGLEGQCFLEGLGSLSVLSDPNHQQDLVFLGDQDSQDSQGLHQVRQAPIVQVAQVRLFLLSFLCHLAILDRPLVLVVLVLHLLNNPAPPYLLGDHGSLSGLVFQLDLEALKFLFSL